MYFNQRVKVLFFRFSRCDGSKQDFSVPCYTILPLKPDFKCAHFSRSAIECKVKNGRITTREQINVNTAFVDASQIYGSSDKMEKNLKAVRGEGKSKYFIVMHVNLGNI